MQKIPGIESYLRRDTRPLGIALRYSEQSGIYFAALQGQRDIAVLGISGLSTQDLPAPGAKMRPVFKSKRAIQAGRAAQPQ